MLAAALVAVACVVALHHVPVGHGATADMDHATMVLCLGVLVGAAGLVAAVAATRRTRLKSSRADPIAPEQPSCAPRSVPARASPRATIVLRL